MMPRDVWGRRQISSSTACEMVRPGVSHWGSKRERMWTSFLSATVMSFDPATAEAEVCVIMSRRDHPSVSYMCTSPEPANPGFRVSNDQLALLLAVEEVSYTIKDGAIVIDFIAYNCE